MIILISIIFMIELCFAAPLHAASEPRAPQTNPQTIIENRLRKAIMSSKQRIQTIRRLATTNGFDINSPDVQSDRTPLMWALEAPRQKRLQVVQELLNLGADPNAKNRNHKTALDLCNEVDCARELIAYGAHDTDDRAVSKARINYDVALLLLIHKEATELQPSNAMPFWLIKIFRGSYRAEDFLKWWKGQDRVRLAIETKINYIYSLCAQPKNPKEWTATERENLYRYNRVLPAPSLHAAIYNSDVATLRRLIAEGANVNQFKDYNLCPPITLAIRQQRKRHGYNECDYPEICPRVTLAERHERRETIIRELLAHGADVNNTEGICVKKECSALLQAQFGPNDWPYPKHLPYPCIELTRDLIAHGAHDRDDIVIREAQNDVALLLLIHKEKRELQPSDDMLPWLTKIFGNDRHALKFLKWWKEQDPVELAIETKINYIYSLCAQPKNPEESIS